MRKCPRRAARAYGAALFSATDNLRRTAFFKEIPMSQVCDTLLTAACIVTQDDERRTLEDAAIAVQDGQVAALGPVRELQAAWTPAQRLDMGESIIIPGLVNSHTHAAMTFLRGIADDLPLMEWLTGHIFPVETRLTPEIVRLGSLLGFAEMLRSGTTACMDMYLFAEQVLEAADTAGLRCTGGEAVFMFPSARCAEPDAALDITRELARRYAGHSRIGLSVTPHAVYTTTPEILGNCRALAEELHLPLHIHLAETATETAQCLEQHGQRPIPYCHALGLLSPRTTLAHVVDATDAELDLLAASGVAVAHNPSSNMKLSSGAARVPDMLRRGIPVGLGTDGPASNNRMNMFTEMGRAALLHKLVSGDPTVCSAQQTLDAATRGGAAALHDARLGRLAVGGPADMAVLSLREPNMRPLFNPVSQLVYAATGMEVCLTMVAGEILYHDGVYTRFDYDDLLRESESLRRWALNKA